MNRNGFVLVSVLWVIVMLSATAAFTAETMAAGVAAARNRIILRQAEWARNACEALILADTTRLTDGHDTGRVDLGQAVWCRAVVEDPRRRFNLNAATPEQLHTILGTDSLVDALLDWRDPDDQTRPAGAERLWYQERGRSTPRNGPLEALAEVRMVRGLEAASIDSLAVFLRTGGDSMLNLAAAPRPVLALVPGLAPSAVDDILRARAFRHPIQNTDELLARISPPARAVLLRNFAAFSGVTAWEAGRLIVHVTGGTAWEHPIAESRLTLVHQGGRQIQVAREEP